MEKSQFGSVGQRIKHLRMEAKLTQEVFGSKIHVSNKTVDNWEHERCSPGYDVIERIAKEFNTSAEWIMTEVDANNRIVVDELGLDNECVEKLKHNDALARMVSYLVSNHEDLLNSLMIYLQTDYTHRYDLMKKRLLREDEQFIAFPLIWDYEHQAGFEGEKRVYYPGCGSEAFEKAGLLALTEQISKAKEKIYEMIEKEES